MVLANAKVIKRRKASTYPELSALEWKAIEKIIDYRVPIKSREIIDEINVVFVRAATHHTPENTISVSKLQTRIKAWEKETRKLRELLGADLTKSAAPKKKIIWRLRKKSKRMSRWTPLPFLDFLLRCASDAATYTLSQSQSPHNHSQRREVWLHWVFLLVLVFEDLGLKTSAPSDQESTFIRFVMSLQDRLPKECRLAGSSQTAAKYVQQAKQKLRTSSAIELHAYLRQAGNSRLVKPRKQSDSSLARLSDR